jgi:hypothetical protein
VGPYGICHYTVPVRFKTLRTRLSLSLPPLAWRYAQIERPLPSFRVGDAASSDILRTMPVFVHPLLLLKAHSACITRDPLISSRPFACNRYTTLMSCASSPTVSERAVCTPVPCFLSATLQVIQAEGAFRKVKGSKGKLEGRLLQLGSCPCKR